MSKSLKIFPLFFLFFSCGYSDIDTVPVFKNIKLNDEELLEYCNISNTDKKDIEKCINDYKS